MKRRRWIAIALTMVASAILFATVWQSTQLNTVAIGLGETDSALAVNKQSNKALLQGGELVTYTLTVTNTGDVVTTTTIIDHLPQQLQAAGDAPSLVWPDITLVPGEAWQETVAVTVTEGYTGSIVNRMIATNQWGQNLSLCTDCAEEDNVNIPLHARGVTSYTVVATHPHYLPNVARQENECMAFTCATRSLSSAVAGVVCAREYTQYDVGEIFVCQESEWWRPGETMSITINNGPILTGQRIVWSKAVISGTDFAYPQFFVLYEDGNMRLKPNPPEGRTDTCFGSSVIVGPAEAIQVEEPSIRPYAAINAVDIDVENSVVTLTYETGGQATVFLDVNREKAVATVMVDYDTALPFATFRSMYVTDNNNDSALVGTEDGVYSMVPKPTESGAQPWEALAGHWWFFHRDEPSIHNVSAPDIRISVAKTAVYPDSSTICSNACLQFLPYLQE